MCEFAAGEVLVSFPGGDGVAYDTLGYAAAEYGYHRVDELSERLSRLAVARHAESLPHEYWLLAVPEGKEFLAITDLYSTYAERSRYGRALPSESPADERFIVGTNGLISGAGRSRTRRGPEFALTAYHDDCLAVSNLVAARPQHRPVRVAVFDTGVDVQAVERALTDTDQGLPLGGVNVEGGFDFTRDDEEFGDSNGHGSVVLSLIASAAPSARLFAAKVLDESGVGTEFDSMAGLAGLQDVDVVNFSMCLGMDPRRRRSCPLPTQVQMSAILERLLSTLPAPPPIIVAATGNRGALQVDAPAAYPQVVAVSATTAGKARSSFSNHGMLDHRGNSHRRRCSIFGGEVAGRRTVAEPVAESVDRRATWEGTSMACAYASGIVGRMIAEDGDLRGADAPFEEALSERCDREFAGYRRASHGEGILAYRVEA